MYTYALIFGLKKSGILGVLGKIAMDKNVLESPFSSE